MGQQSNTNPKRRLTRLDAPIQRAPALALLLLTPLAPAQTPATSLPLLLPSAIAFGASGNLYIADTNAHVIRELTPSGLLTTIAGDGTQGFSGDNGPATSASLDSPSGLALDAAGNLYLADTHNHRIREVLAATGIILTVAGAGTPGFSGDNGPATSAQLDSPTALALDTQGNLYLADTGNHRIREIAASTGLIATVAGDGIQGFSGDNGPATSASLDSPTGLALDAQGNLYLADTHNHRIREVLASTGIITTVAGDASPTAAPQTFAGDNGPAASATLALPRGLTLDSAGNLYVADTGNHRIRRISPSGAITTVAGQGTQTFAGDNAPAVAASLDSPRSVAVSPSGLLTLADTANARVRQLDQLPAPGPDIHTIAGLGVTAGADALALSGPSTVAYGSGFLTATLAAPTLATGSITFFDTTPAGQSTAGQSTLASTPLTANSAALDTSILPAGLYTILATYSGDPTHTAAQSSAFALTVAPLALTAIVNPVSILYGQPVPALTGTLSGVRPRDAGQVSAIFSTSAATLSPTGNYPIAASLTGPAAANYALPAIVDSLTTGQPSIVAIAPAPTVTTLAPSTTTTSPGLPITLTVSTAATTSGTPTGTITLLDGSTPLSTLPLSSTNSSTSSAAFTTSTLALGTHSLTAVYSGDSNFLPSTSSVASITIASVSAAPPSGFTFAVSGSASQSVPSGSPANYTFAVSTEGPALTSPITLAVSGVPLGSTASINPASIPPGGAVTSFTLTIQTPKAAFVLPPARRNPQPPQPLLAILLLPVLFLRKRSPRTPILLLASCILSTGLLAGCGNRVNSSSETADATVYTLTVTGTATSPSGVALQHSIHVTLQVL